METETPVNSPVAKKRPANNWVKHTQAYAKKHKVSYKTAMRDAGKSYHKGKKKTAVKPKKSVKKVKKKSKQ